MENSLLEPTPSPTLIREGSPTIFLRGENLEYYRNIEYLKEVTRQANALLDRSNATYENILDDQKLGYRVRARSNSDSTKSISPEMEGKCKKCGLAHGAANFCIVEQIMDNERQIEDNKRKSKVSKGSWKSFMSISVDSKSLKHQADLKMDEASTKEDRQRNIWENINILEKMTPSQVLETYETLCARYGTNTGRTFLVANSKAHPPEKKIEKWMTPSEHHPKRTPELSKIPLTHYEDLGEQCPIAEPHKYEPVCPSISREVREKMEQLVQLIPPCEGQPLDECEKNWRAVFREHPPKQDEASAKEEQLSEKVDFESSFTDEPCKCKIHQCVCGTEKICTTPKVEKECNITRHEDDHENNYLLTMRKKIMRRKETKRAETIMFSKQSIPIVVKTRTNSEEFLDKARTEQYETLKNCLTERLKDEGYDRHEFRKNVQKIADATSPNTAINPRQWDHWYEQMQEQEKIEEQDEIDSLPSDIQTDRDSISEISHSTGVDYKPGRIKPSRIPYAEDVYDLIDNLYDKISRKFEKSVLKNSFKTIKPEYRPNYAFLHRRMDLLSDNSPLFREIMNLAKFPSYPKQLTTFRVRKARKMKRLKALQRRGERTKRRRDMARGLQLGKRYRKISQSYKYAPESGYIGFKQQERRMLDPNEPDRFAKFSSAEDPIGKAITKKRIHHDFKLMCRMFEDAAKVKREDLMDQGMLERLYKFQKKMYSVKLPHPPLTDTDTENEGHSDYTYRIPPRNEVQMLQKANGESEYRNLPKQLSCENVPHRKEIRCNRTLKAGKSNSAEKFENGEVTHCTTARSKICNNKCTPKKCTSSTNVKGEKSKDTENFQRKKADPWHTHSRQNLQMRSCVKSLTNLLPPLKGHNAKPMANNEFEETISSLQNELSNLLTRHSGGTKSDAPIKTNESNKVKPFPKKRNSALTKLPELKTSSRKNNSKISKSKLSDESLPRIKQRESVENLKPGVSQEKLPGKGLARKTSMMNLRSVNYKSLTNEKLPLLVENRNLGSDSSNESKNRKKSASKRPKLKVPAIPKQSGFKAWR